MKTAVYTVLVSWLCLSSLSCNRFEANHEQIPAVEQQDPKDKTNVAQDTAIIASPDTSAH